MRSKRERREPEETPAGVVVLVCLDRAFWERKLVGCQGVCLYDMCVFVSP